MNLPPQIGPPQQSVAVQVAAAQGLPGNVRLLTFSPEQTKSAGHRFGPQQSSATQAPSSPNVLQGAPVNVRFLTVSPSQLKFAGQSLCTQQSPAVHSAPAHGVPSAAARFLTVSLLQLKFAGHVGFGSAHVASVPSAGGAATTGQPPKAR